jgi:hypothetical protein
MAAQVPAGLPPMTGTHVADRPTSAHGQTLAPPPGGGSRKRLLAIGGAVLALVAIAAVAVIALGGGGDGGGGGGAEKPRLSKADYEDQVADITNALSVSASKVSLPAALPNIADERVKISTQLIGLKTAERDAADKMDAINPPTDVQDLHDTAVSTFREQAGQIAAAQAAAETNDSDGYKTSLDAYTATQDKLNQLTADFRQRGYERLGATPGNDTGHALTGEEREVADTVQSAQVGFRDQDVETYCLSRSSQYLDRAYGGSYSYKSCTKAGKAGLTAEIPDVLSGGDLSITDIAIDKGGKGNLAEVTATGDGGRQVIAEVTRHPPSDDVWRVNAFDTP